MNRTDSILTINGIGPKSAELLQKVGIDDVDDLLHYYPRSYVTYGEPSTTQDLSEGYHITLDGCIRGSIRLRRNGKKSVVTAVFADLFGEVPVIWFNMPYLKKMLMPGRRFILRGRVQRNGKTLELTQPEVYTPEAYAAKKSMMQPVYSLTAGLKNGVFIRALKDCLFKHPELFSDKLNIFTEELQNRYELLDHADSLRKIHFPQNETEYRTARKSLVFEEFLLFLLALRLGTNGMQSSPNAFSFEKTEYLKQYRAALPFALTKGQELAFEEVIKDLTGPDTMNRLIQGDVGSGKTVLAVMALLLVVNNGYQGAMMAPTEVLARQHYESIRKELLDMGLPVHVVLLTGSMTQKEKRITREAIEAGEADIIIGTHALIQEAVIYHNLALVITDEQHRFGVKQREELSKKGAAPHTLVMSATPIPRTLALILYGDLAISTIRELPKERLPIKNCAVDTGYRNTAYKFIFEQIKAGHQAYIICPLVEPSEEIDGEDVGTYAGRLRDVFSDTVRIGVLHGRMKQDEKNAVMADFAENKTQILVSTTVVEVGVNVPNATVMMVENAESFGLSALHQLRGRVGRGAAQSYCIFVSGKKNKDAKKRLSILVQTNDGFTVAEKDLMMRGPGEMLGVRQSGEPGFRIGDIVADSDVLKDADRAAKTILLDDPFLTKEENRELRLRVETLKNTLIL